MVSEIPFSVRYMGIIGHYTVEKYETKTGGGSFPKHPYSTRINTGGFYALFSVSYGLNLTGLPNR